MRKTFHEELKSLSSEIIQMGELVERAIDRAVKSLVKGDLDLAAEVIRGDDEIDHYKVDLEEQCTYIIARQCPVAKDLRLIHSILFISSHLERMGDLALNMAKTTKRTSEEESVPALLDLISEMGEQTKQVVRTSLEAFAKKDVALAKTLPKLDEPIDKLFKQFFKELAHTAVKRGPSLEWASNMVLASRYLERIADHSVDIGERVSYLVTGIFEEWD